MHTQDPVARALRPGRAHAARCHAVSHCAGHRVVARWASCRCSLGRVAVSCRTCTSPLVETQKSCRDTKPYHARRALCCGRCCAVSQHCCAVSRARCCSPLHPGQAVLCPGTRLCPACRDTFLLYHDHSWKMGSSPSSFFSCTLFFSLFHSL